MVSYFSCFFAWSISKERLVVFNIMRSYFFVLGGWDHFQKKCWCFDKIQKTLALGFQLTIHTKVFVFFFFYSLRKTKESKAGCSGKDLRFNGF